MLILDIFGTISVPTATTICFDLFTFFDRFDFPSTAEITLALTKDYTFFFFYFEMYGAQNVLESVL